MEFSVTESQRLDAFLSSQMEDVSRSRIQKSIKDGLVKVNGSTVTKPAQVLQEGDAVVVSDDAFVSSSESEEIEAKDLGLDILYEDDACMVINKPAGYAVHGAPGMPKDEVTILNGLAHLFDERSLSFSADVVLVHRLDKETTGCLLVAKNADAHHALQQQFSDRTVSKTYLTVVAGVPNPPNATIDAPIGRNLTDRTKMSVLKTSTSRDAKTTYSTLDATNECALLSCDLHTGRTHQIRVHLASIHHPILGDPTYHSPSSEKLSKQFGVTNLCLHAKRLSFASPETSKQVVVEAEIPHDFSLALEATSLEYSDRRA